jgi:antitoxin component YwqK of YwqJK toxin-antitoxin module
MSSDGSVSASNEDIYTYNDMGLLTEKLSKSNGSVTLREVNGYYDNGSIKSRKHYSHGELVYAVYYDEDGNVIMN